MTAAKPRTRGAGRGRPSKGTGLDLKEAILDSAEGLFARHGFYGVTTRQVASEAGVDTALWPQPERRAALANWMGIGGRIYVRTGPGVQPAAQRWRGVGRETRSKGETATEGGRVWNGGRFIMKAATRQGIRATG